MPPGAQELKFCTPLVQALAVLEHSLKHPRSIQVLCFPRATWVAEFQPILESLLTGFLGQGPAPIRIDSWPAWEHAPWSPISSSITQKQDRLRALSGIHERKTSQILLCSLDSWLQPTLPPHVFTERSLVLRVDEDAGSREALLLRLRELGYVRCDLVEEPGQFALRGEILDFFDPAASSPVRIDFFDTVPETIRAFHPETQRTLKASVPTPEISIGPAEEVLFPWSNPEPVLELIKDYCDAHQISRKIRDPVFENIRNGFLPEHFRTWFPFVYGKTSRLADHLPSASRILLYEPEQVALEEEALKASWVKEREKYPQPYWIAPSIDLIYPASSRFIQETLIKPAQFLVRAATLSDSSPSPLFYETLPVRRPQAKDFERWQDEGFQVWIGTRGPSHQERVRFLLKDLLSSRTAVLLPWDSGESLVFPGEKKVLLSETLIFGSTNKKSKPQSSAVHPSFDSESTGLEFHHADDLSPGDLVVHSLHGVGRYSGLQELRSGDRALGEYLLIEYAGGDKLYLPVYRLNLLQRYITPGAGGSLDRLGTGQFEKAKQKARESAKKLAINLVEIYAKRAVLQGPKFVHQDDTYFEFCDQFEFTETEGQLRATKEVLQDLEEGKLLDRLVCGDVGFGKTEVAIRAAFQAVQSGQQVAVLVPTTLLAFQHEQSFRRRMAAFPIRIESLSRFKTRKMQLQTTHDLREGKIDILIGTHRILSKDVAWNKLGLLVVDEEHRFGVEHKEKIKAIQANTHTLTLTATPIPRTLNMALSGLKDISVIKTPPSNRQPIKTFVSSHSPELIKSAIESELARGGQVFYLYNRVQSIEHEAREIQRLVPQARIIVAHGQMTEDEIESRMLEFYQGHAQVLVCTTIVESGIDVPNAGTMIIHRADLLGLAQLYQIRGRVGRSHKKAYAYLLVDEERNLTPEARMRLDVLQRFVELGSGFQIASYDLEIRGGGNLLGGEQSGHIASVGLDLFTELLNEAIQELKGKASELEDRQFEPEIQVPVLCEIPTTLVPDPKLRLSLYRKISNARTGAQVDGLQDEFRDRFGDVPPETLNLFWLIRLKNLFKRTGIEAASISAEKSSLTVRKVSAVEPDEVMKLYAGPKGLRDPRVQLTPDSKIVYKIPFNGLQSHLFEIEALLQRIAPKAFENAKTD